MPVMPLVAKMPTPGDEIAVPFTCANTPPTTTCPPLVSWLVTSPSVPPRSGSQIVVELHRATLAAETVEPPVPTLANVPPTYSLEPGPVRSAYTSPAAPPPLSATQVLPESLATWLMGVAPLLVKRPPANSSFWCTSRSSTSPLKPLPTCAQEWVTASYWPTWLQVTPLVWVNAPPAYRSPLKTTRS